MLEHTPAEIVRQLIMDEGLADDSGSWQSFVSFFPDQPNESICFYDTAGIQDGRVMLTGERIEHDGIQVRVRGRDYNDAWKRINDIGDYLDTVKNEEVVMDSGNAYTIYAITRRGAIIPLGVDPNDDHHRHNFTLNITTSINKG